MLFSPRDEASDINIFSPIVFRFSFFLFCETLLEGPHNQSTVVEVR